MRVEWSVGARSTVAAENSYLASFRVLACEGIQGPRVTAHAIARVTIRQKFPHLLPGPNALLQSKWLGATFDTETFILYAKEGARIL